MATYYVSQTDGNDSYNGLYPTYQGESDGPWLTFTKAAGGTYSAGDSILFNRGDTFAVAYNEIWTLSPTGTSGENITIGAYGSGAKPILNQCETTSGDWTYYGSGYIWYKTITGYVNRVWWDGQESGKAASVGDISSSPCRWFFDDATDRLYLYDGSATLNPNEVYTTITINRGSQIFSATDVDYWIFDNLDVRGSSCQFYLGGSADHLTWQDCTFKDIGTNVDSNSATIYSSWFGSGRNDYNSIIDCTIDNNGSLISQNLPAEANMVWGDNISLNDCSCNWLIQGNIFYDMGHGAIGINSASVVETDLVNDNIIEYNSFINEGSPFSRAWGISGYDNHCERNIYRYNYVAHANQCVQIGGTDTEVYYNIFYHIDTSPVLAGGAQGLTLYTPAASYVCENVQIYNNLFMETANQGMVLLYNAEIGPTNCKIKNNIVLNCGDAGDDGWWGIAGVGIFVETGVATTNTIDKNLIYNDSYANTIAYKTEYPDVHTVAWADANTVEFVSNLSSDPLVGVDFKIPSNSPCKDAGVDVSLTEDYWGTSIPHGAAPDIGAHEYAEIERLKRYSGAAFVSGKLMVYQGGIWQQRPVKRWSGTAWVDVDALGS